MESSVSNIYQAFKKDYSAFLLMICYLLFILWQWLTIFIHIKKLIIDSFLKARKVLFHLLIISFSGVTYILLFIISSM